MNKLLSFLFLTLLISACGQKPAPSTSEIKTTASKIIDGTEVTEENIYSIHTVIVHDLRRGSYCTGVLIEDDLVLTAGHCLDQDSTKDDIVIMLGKTRKEWLFRHRARAIARHEHFLNFGGAVMNDIGLIRLNYKVPGPYKPIDLEDTRMLQLESKAKVTSLGYGIKNFKTKEGLGVLRMKVLSIKYYKNADPFIVLDQRKGGLCSGDSGGPTFTLVNDKVVLVGIASHGRKSRWAKGDTCDYNAVLSNPNYFYDWINNNKTSL